MPLDLVIVPETDGVFEAESAFDDVGAPLELLTVDVGGDPTGPAVVEPDEPLDVEDELPSDERPGAPVSALPGAARAMPPSAAIPNVARAAVLTMRLLIMFFSFL